MLQCFARDEPLILPPERLALRWIQKYITAFGGDPTKVTMCVPTACLRALSFSNAVI